MKSNAYFLTLFLTTLKGSGYASKTIDSVQSHVNHFFRYLITQHVQDIRDVREKNILSFLSYLQTAETNYNRPYTKGSIKRIISCVRSFFTYLYRYNHILHHPAEHITLSAVYQEEKQIFTPQEITFFLDSTQGQRNRALFELMYSSGLRISEAVNLDLPDLDIKERMLAIRAGKGAKDRYVPFSTAAAFFLKHYLKGDRKKSLSRIGRKEIKALFLTENGRIKIQTVRLAFKKQLTACSLEDKGLTPHSIRHTTATRLLENGADIRYVQELLGHESIETTASYTHLMKEHLKRAIKTSHPRENKLYEEITPAYLSALDSLEQEILTRNDINRRYPPQKYNTKKI